jgi:hypothetical protein
MTPRQEKKFKQAFLAALDPAPLSTNKGSFDGASPSGANTKDRRHSGRIEVFSDDEDYPTQFVFWDNWTDFRDGFRNIHKDLTRIKKYNRKGTWFRADFTEAVQSNNKKIKRLERIKRARKISKKNFEGYNNRV